MSDSHSPLPPNPPHIPAESAKTPRTRCEFCGCQLAPDGSVMAFSDRARELRDQTERITKLEGALSQAEGAGEMFKRDAEQLRAQLATVTTKADEVKAATGW